ncbi:MAG: 2-keto-3-deoxygluconate permease [Enterocloster clostridioformis]
MSAITNSSGSLYISLSSQFGNATDTGAISILSLNDGPFFTLVPWEPQDWHPFLLRLWWLRGSPAHRIYLGNMDKGFRSACATAAYCHIFSDHIYWFQDRCHPAWLRQAPQVLCWA